MSTWSSPQTSCHCRIAEQAIATSTRSTMSIATRLCTAASSLRREEVASLLVSPPKTCWDHRRLHSPPSWRPLVRRRGPMQHVSAVCVLPCVPQSNLLSQLLGDRRSISMIFDIGLSKDVNYELRVDGKRAQAFHHSRKVLTKFYLCLRSRGKVLHYRRHHPAQ